MHTKYILCVLLVSFCLLSQACSTKHAPTAVNTSEPSVVVPVDRQIAEFIGNGYEGSSQTFMNTHYGTATVTVGRSYHSALNLPCKEAHIQGSQRTRVAACQDGDKGWILAPDILGDGAL